MSGWCVTTCLSAMSESVSRRLAGTSSLAQTRRGEGGTEGGLTVLGESILASVGDCYCLRVGSVYHVVLDCCGVWISWYLRVS